MKGKTFKIVQREIGYQNPHSNGENLSGVISLIGSLFFFGVGAAILYFRKSGFFTEENSWKVGGFFLVSGFFLAVFYMAKDLDFGGGKIKTIHNWNDDKKPVSQPNELRDYPLNNIWVYLLMAGFLLFFNWLLFFVADSYVGYVIGIFFFFILFLLAKQGVEKIISYQKYGISKLILNQNPIPKGGMIEVVFKNKNVQNDFPKLSCTLQFLEEYVKETKASDGSKSRSKVFKSWYRATDGFYFGHDGCPVSIQLPDDFPGNIFSGGAKKYWVLDVESIGSDSSFKTTFFLPVV